MITQHHIDSYATDGAVMIPGLLSDWVDIIAQGIDQNMAEPGPYAAENTTATDTGRFFDDYCNWPRIPAFEKTLRDSPAGQAAAQIMQSQTAQFFHDHVLVKEPGTSKKTPWHQDSPYYFVEGRQTVSMWVPVDPVGLDSCPQFIKGSHHWDKLVLPVRWLDDSGFYPDANDYLPVPNPDAEPDRYSLMSWTMQPGDAILFDYRTVHGAPANQGPHRRRAFSMRWVG
ncbi:MAG TPA: phytanoyl-CoA dioxygenase, partial [Rhodospirillaceae bacterium]|nr:phytanoyl-CoA dioxygenase [Rhodospirillaceae bacterium]